MKKKVKKAKRFDIAAFELFNNKLFRPKVIKNKKKEVKKFNKNKEISLYVKIFNKSLHKAIDKIKFLCYKICIVCYKIFS